MKYEISKEIAEEKDKIAAKICDILASENVNIAYALDILDYTKDYLLESSLVKNLTASS